MKKYIALLLVLANPAFAEGNVISNSAITVHTGDTVAPQYDKGTLLDLPQANKIKDQLIDADTCKDMNTSYQKSIELYKSNSTIYQDENTLLLNRNLEMTKALNDSRTTSDWEKIGYFALGVVATSLAVYGATKIIK